MVNAIKNPGFESGMDEWSIYGWYSGNKVEHQATGGIDNGKCVKLTVPAEKGQSHIYTHASVMPGSHTLKFNVKRIIGDVDVWIMLYVNGAWKYSPSFIPQLTSSFTELSYTFAATGYGMQNVEIRLIAGSAEGVALFDNVSLMVDESEYESPYDGWLYANVIQNDVRLRDTPSTSGSIVGYYPKGRRAVIKDAGNGWFKCRWKNKDAYILGTTLSPPTANEDMERYILVNVANQEVNAQHNGNPKYYNKELDNNGDWCHWFADWITCHCLWPFDGDLNIPQESNVRNGISFFLQSDSFYFVHAEDKVKAYGFSDLKEFMSQAELTNAEMNYRAEIGDYVYFRIDDTTKISRHVGVVIDVSSNGTTITSIEGNASAKGSQAIGNNKVFIQPPLGPDVPGKRFNSDIVGFGKPYYGNG